MVHKAGVPWYHWYSRLVLLVFLIYTNDVTKYLLSTTKVCADDNSIFAVVKNMNASANRLNKDLQNMSN